MARIVIALGGNALGNSPEEQQKKIDEAAPALIGLIKQGHEIIVSHGNGPQVGIIKSSLDKAAKDDSKAPEFPLAECTALSQGYIGYHLQNGILRELRLEGMPWQVATIVTQVEVLPNDPAFNNPTKPIGAYFSKDEAEKIMVQNPGIVFKEDSGRGWRKTVASPKPVDIVEKESILHLLDNEFIVIACGGGGIPVVKDNDGDYKGVDAVIDKDFASALLAELVDAEYLFILTAVDKVCINFGKENQIELDEMSISQAEEYIKENQFGKGSMQPKIEAAVKFAKSKPGRRAVIASLEKAPLAMKGLSGTVIYK